MRHGFHEALHLDGDEAALLLVECAVARLRHQFLRPHHQIADAGHRDFFTLQTIGERLEIAVVLIIERQFLVQSQNAGTGNRIIARGQHPFVARNLLLRLADRFLQVEHTGQTGGVHLHCRESQTHFPYLIFLLKTAAYKDSSASNISLAMEISRADAL